MRGCASDSKRIFPTYYTRPGFNLAPEVPNLQPSSRGAVSRSNSREQERIEVVPGRTETLFENFQQQQQVRTKSTLVGDVHRPISDNRGRHVEKDDGNRENDGELVTTRRFRDRFEDFEISYRDFRRFSEEYLAESKDTNHSKVLYPYDEKLSVRCINSISSDYLSLSLSPIERDKPLPYLHTKSARYVNEKSGSNCSTRPFNVLLIL